MMLRPMRPNPLIPTLTAIDLSSSADLKVGLYDVAILKVGLHHNW
jgi:hypothetical protein